MRAQLQPLMGCVMVRPRPETGKLTLQSQHDALQNGEIHVFDAEQADFMSATLASHVGTGPYRDYVEHDGQILCD
jgi:carbonic anhydrase